MRSASEISSFGTVMTYSRIKEITEFGVGTGETIVELLKYYGFAGKIRGYEIDWDSSPWTSPPFSSSTSPKIREIVWRYLQAGGTAVAEQADGPSALRAALHQPPDLIVLDVMLRGLDGVEALHRCAQPAKYRSSCSPPATKRSTSSSG